MGERQTTSLKLHKITNAFYLIIIIPFLILGFLSSLVMFNSKMAGGYPNLLDHYVVQIQDNSFYNEETGQYKEGSYQTFKKVDINTLKPGDFIAYYSGHTEDIANGTAPDWVPIDPNIKLGSGSTDAVTDDGKATVSVVKVGNYKGFITTDSGQVFECISYFSSNSAEEENYDYNTLLLTVDIIGVAVENNEMIVEFMVYSSTFNGFLTFILIPALFLVMMKIISLWFYRKYMVDANFNHKARIISEDNNFSYSRVLFSNNARIKKPPKRVKKSLWESIQPNYEEKPKRRGWWKKNFLDSPFVFKSSSIEKPIKQKKKKQKNDDRIFGKAEKYAPSMPKRKPINPKDVKQKKARDFVPMPVLNIKPVTTDEYGKMKAKSQKTQEKLRRKARKFELQKGLVDKQRLQNEKQQKQQIFDAESKLLASILNTPKGQKQKLDAVKPKIKLKEKPVESYFKTPEPTIKPIFSERELRRQEKQRQKMQKRIDAENAMTQKHLEDAQRRLLEASQKPAGHTKKTIPDKLTRKIEKLNKTKQEQKKKKENLDYIFGKPQKPTFAEKLFEKKQAKLQNEMENKLLEKEMSESESKILKGIPGKYIGPQFNKQKIKNKPIIAPPPAVKIDKPKAEKNLFKTYDTPSSALSARQAKIAEHERLKEDKKAQAEKEFLDRQFKQSQARFLESVMASKPKKQKNAKRKTPVINKPVTRQHTESKTILQPTKVSVTELIPAVKLKDLPMDKKYSKISSGKTEDVIFTTKKYDFLIETPETRAEKRQAKKRRKEQELKAKKRAQAEAAREFWQAKHKK